jgi:hypothetical protein
MGPREIEWEYLDWMHLVRDRGQWQTDSNGFSGSIKGWEFLDWLSDYLPLKWHCTRCSQLYTSFRLLIDHTVTSCDVCILLRSLRAFTLCYVMLSVCHPQSIYRKNRFSPSYVLLQIKSSC